MVKRHQWWCIVIRHRLPLVVCSHVSNVSARERTDGSADGLLTLAVYVATYQCDAVVAADSAT